MRLGCVLTSAALLVSLVVEPPKAKAFAVSSSAVSALAGGFLNACGLAPVVSGMGSSDEVNESIARLLQDYLNTEVGGQSILEWAGDIALSAKDGKLIVSKLLVDKLAQFAVYVASKYATKPGVNVVYRDQSITFSGGEKYIFTSYTVDVPDDSYTVLSYNIGTPITFAGTVDSGFIRLSIPDTEYYFRCYMENNNACIGLYKGSSSRELKLCAFYLEDYDINTITFCPTLNGTGFTVGGYFGRHAQNYTFNTYYDFAETMRLSTSLSVVQGLSIDAAETVQQVLDRLTALEEGQSIALDVGATQSMEIQEILQGILDAILAGNLAASAEVVAEAVEPVDPPAETLPDVDGLGLPALGAALTSRFPFSIPWDVYKGISLLAAPAKAPYFEVDFMAPIADEVGGWKGSTKIVLDFSEFEIIGQVCRWTSTIGFCLMLATATKRLIWTA